MCIGKNDHSLDTPGDRGSTPLILPMKTLVVPCSHTELVFVHIGDQFHYADENDLEEMRDWVSSHKDDWPNNFAEFHKAFGALNFPLRLEIFPTQNPENEYVFVLETENSATEGDKAAWRNVLGNKDFASFTVFCHTAFFHSIKRINKNLLPFL